MPEPLAVGDHRPSRRPRDRRANCWRSASWSSADWLRAARLHPTIWAVQLFRLHPWRASIVGLLLVSLMVTAYLTATSGPGESSRRAVARPTAGDIDAIESAVISRDPAAVRSAFGASPHQRLGPKFVEELRRWRALEIELSTYAAKGPGFGTVEAELIRSGLPTTRWQLGIERTPADTWFIATTEEIGP